MKKNKKIIIGEKIGKWTIKKEVGRNKHGHRMWLCECDCDEPKTREISGSRLGSGKNISCDCEKENLTGMKFGRLTVLEKSELSKDKKESMWLCECSCDNKTRRVVRAADLKNGHTKGCGCLTGTTTTVVHGLSNDRIYRIHSGMMSRCYNPKSAGYENYGGRGITVCEEWLGSKGFENFYKWANLNDYDKELSIDRIDVNGNYEPSNCRWSNDEEQSNNKRNNVFLEIEGKTMTVSQWARAHNLNPIVIFQRLKLGWTGRDLLKQKRENKNKK